METLMFLVRAYNIVEAELFATFDGEYQGKRSRALFILTKMIIDEILKKENQE